MGKLLIFGSLNVDYVYHVPHFVTPGETLAASKREVNCGGKGLNQSIAAARAGATVFHAGKIGADGQILTDMLSQSGVDISYIQHSSGPSGHAIIQVDPSGQNCILLFGGSNQEITTQEVDQVLTHFGPGDRIILQNEINNLAYIMQQAAARGLDIVFNPSPIDASIQSLPLELVSLLVLNEIEGAALAGTEDESLVLKCLRKQFPLCRILLTLGSRGCVYDDGTQRIQQKACSVEAVDTTAAGDTFTGYFVAADAAGFPPQECLQLATQAAAIAVSRSGAAPSIPIMEEVTRFSELS